MTLRDKIANLAWYDLIAKLKDILGILGSSALPEAPIDGIQYGREDGEWTPISNSGGTVTLQSAAEGGDTITNIPVTIHDASKGAETILTGTGIEIKSDSFEVNDRSTSLIRGEISLIGRDEVGDIILNTFISEDQVSISGVDGKQTNYRINQINNSDRTIADENVNHTLTFAKDIAGIFNQNFQAKSGTIALLSDITGGSQTLQQTLENGNEANFTAYDYIGLLYGIDGSREIQLQTGSSDTIRTNIALSNERLSLTGQSDLSVNATIIIDNSLLSINQQNNDGVTHIKFTTPQADTNILFPAPAIDGDYTIATLDNITLQKSIDNNPLAEVDSGNSTVAILAGSENSRFTGIFITDGVDKESTLTIDNDTFILYNRLGDIQSNVRSDSGVLKLSYATGAGAGTSVLFEDPTIISTLKFPAPAIAGDYIIATEDQIDALKNESGQVKVNYTGLNTTNFTADVEKILDINAATPTIVSSPTTTFPISTPNNYGGFFDATRGITPTGRLIENPINGQVHTWRIQLTYSGKTAGSNGSLDIILANPVSGFTYVLPFTLPSGRTSGTINSLAITIADQESIPDPRGYILKAITSFNDATLSINIDSITRISAGVEL